MPTLGLTDDCVLYNPPDLVDILSADSGPVPFKRKFDWTRRWPLSEELFVDPRTPDNSFFVSHNHIDLTTVAAPEILSGLAGLFQKIADVFQ
jgi:hypothetical protein